MVQKKALTPTPKHAISQRRHRTTISLRRSMFKRLARQVCPRAPFLVPRSVLQGSRPASRCVSLKKKVSGRERFKKFTLPAQQKSIIRTENPSLAVCTHHLCIYHLSINTQNSHFTKPWVETVGKKSTPSTPTLQLLFYRTTIPSR